MITTKRAWIAAGIVIVFVLFLGALNRYHQAKLSDLKIENARIYGEYNQKLGEAHAKELAAREEAMQATALVAAVEQGNKNVAALDLKLEGVRGNYEQAKSDLGDCAEPDDCLRSLCAELRAAGFKVECP